MPPTSQHRLAVLIDSDNISPERAESLFDEVASYGTASVRRMYGDWTSDRLRGWKEAANRLAIQPIQQFAYTSGKNATDSAMIIDAMDLLYTGTFEGFCLVSSDSDFTRLATRLRESGAVVYGFGERRTPEAFRKACDQFIFFDVLGSDPDVEPTDRPPARQTTATLQENAALVKLLRAAVQAASDDDGWADLGRVGSQIRSRSPEFDSRTYGFAKLGDLLRAVDLFPLEETRTANGVRTRVCMSKKIAQRSAAKRTQPAKKTVKKAAAKKAAPAG